MPRIVYRGSSFERVGSMSWFEREYEDLVLYRSSEIFPRWTSVRFTAVVTAPGGDSKKPDLALIDRHYREWWVVEVELQHHSLQGHVLPQVGVFADARYTDAHADWIADNNEGLDRERLRAMMRGEPPKVLVIVDSPATSWERDLSDLGVRLSVVEPFRDPNGEFLLRVNGAEPEPPGQILSRLSRDPTLARMWTVHSPAALPQSPQDGPFEIFYRGVPSEWHRIPLTDSVMLRATRGNPLTEVGAVDLVLRDDFSLEFIEATAVRRSRK